ncbi:MAG: AAA family ATPase [Thermoleophilaceae bacterium]|nr:AAA family ATPase [Thermoleophilaceae bacterium]
MLGVIGQAPNLKREQFLPRALAGHDEAYDVVLVDCPPNLGLLTVNALCAVREALVPIDMEDVDALQGAEEARGHDRSARGDRRRDRDHGAAAGPR